MIDWLFENWPPLVVGGFLIFIVGASIASCEERKEWEAFRDSNGCHATGKQRLRNHTTYVYKSSPVTTAIAQDEWLCRNGERLWRDAE